MKKIKLLWMAMLTLMLPALQSCKGDKTKCDKLSYSA